ncbi:hypothetical protein NF865_08700 [Thermococcus aggregans]|uniref:Uncharacterized protein n=1 Tax=Thermococcus aggregans TaxID=110163 RepID=A0A9E7SP21_THEAG|nr:hypothetical protein [Thermococcus aggregans]USS40377.1 hypothetical protein NF865_08700 [Thermococcus aggregans]
MNPLYLVLSIFSILLAIYFNRSNQREIGLIAAGFAGGFAFLYAFEERYSAPLAFAGGFIATVLFELLRFRPIRKD